MEQIGRANYRVSHFYDATPPGRILRVTYQCPLCGATLGLKGHEIHPDGSVTPAVLCPYCDFNDMIKLEGWKHERPKVQN